MDWISFILFYKLFNSISCQLVQVAILYTCDFILLGSSYLFSIPDAIFELKL